MSERLRIIFAGTPQISKIILEDILNNGFLVDLVLTQPDRPSGRGKKIAASPVKELALEKKLTILQPFSLKNNAEILQQLKQLKPDLMIVFAYGMILPKEVLEIPQYGCVNIHVSLLPRWRGAAPIQRSIIAGDKVTGVTLMQMDEGLDTGDILLQEQLEIHDIDTSLSLTNRLTQLSSKLILNYLNNYAQIVAKPQPQIGITYAHKIEKSEASINWLEDATMILLKIRGFNPFPGCFTNLDNQLIKIWDAEIANLSTKLDPGYFLIQNKAFYIGCGNNTILSIKQLQLSGKNRQSIQDYLNSQPKIIDKKFT